MSSPVKKTKTKKQGSTIKESTVINFNGSQSPERQSRVGAGLTETSVEIEHLKTTCIALQEKIVVVNDLRTDVDSGRNEF